MSYTGRLAKACIKKEVTYGTYVEGDIPLRIISSSVQPNTDYEEDPALIGEVHTTDEIPVGKNVSGGIEILAHPEELGVLTSWALGGESAVANPAQGYLFIWYTGSELYADIVVSSNVLTASVGDDAGTKTADTNFNTTGSIDLTTASFDTLAEVATAIDGYTGWNASYQGLSTADTSQIADLAAYKLVEGGLKVRGAVLECTVTSTVAKKHFVYPAAATSNLPSYSYMEDKTLGAGTAIAYTGMKVNSFGITIDAKSLVKLSLDLKGRAEETGKTYPTLTIPTNTAYKVSNVAIYLDETELTVAKNFSITNNGNLDDSPIIGSLYSDESIRQMNTLEISGSINLNTTTWAERSKYTNGTKCEILIYFETEVYADTSNTVVYATLIRLNKVILKDFNTLLSGPDRLVINVSGKAVNSADHETVEFTIVDQDTSTY